MLTSATYRKIVLGSAIYDLLVTAPFATPWSFAFAHAQLDATNQALGGAALPAFTPFHVLFACLLGSVVLVWATLRLRDPQAHYGRYDGVARLLFTTWMIWALTATGAPLLWLFIVPELAWGVIQWLPVVPPSSARGQESGRSLAPRTGASRP
ncbi:hypothetical protein GJ698_27735 [Pseudoduganella sp. FT26W]|uniref:Uncharacterized protein n=1 Tax=Duganella aquatilis TaxID=2666082 RepID=A0A844DGI1_9BURK|nr:hypothetical protein [Duganella aquatilis]MRW87870.1 hypothetical protein [Duganella aquatilis]